jgi:PAS domain S-box-containing protein
MKVLRESGLLRWILITGSLLLATGLVVTYQSNSTLQRSAFWVEHTLEVQHETDLLAIAVKDLEELVDEYRPDGLRSVRTRIFEQVDRVRTLTTDNPNQQVRLDTLQSVLPKLPFLADTGNDSAALRSLGTGEALARVRKLFGIVERVAREEDRLLIIRRESYATRIAFFNGVLYAVLTSLIGLAIFIFWAIRRNAGLHQNLADRNENLERTLNEVKAYQYALDESAIVAITDHKGVIRHVNDFFCKISRYNREALLGKDLRIINSGYHDIRTIQQLWVTISSGQVWRGELCNRAQDGTIYWVDTSIIPFLNSAGKPYQYVTIQFDITERKNIERLRQEKEKLEKEVISGRAELANIFDRITDGFIVLDRDFRYVYANRRIGEITGYAVDSLIGKIVWDVFPDAVASATYVNFVGALEDQKYRMHLDYYGPLNLWQENYIYPSPEGLSVFIRDVTLQKRAEQELIKSERIYKTIAANIPGAVICLMDAEYRYSLIEGDDILERLGYERQRLLGQRAADVLTPERLEIFTGQMRRVFAGEAYSVDDHRGPHDLVTRFVPLRDDQGAVYAAMAVAFDVTELKQAERRIKELNIGLERKIEQRTAQLASANKELESFSYSVAHDLRTPLRAVSGYVTILVEDHEKKLDAECVSLLAEIGYNTRKMGSLIDDLLTFSRLGRKAVVKSVVDMNAMVGSTVGEVPGAARITRFRNLHPLIADASLIRQVVTNLVSNAVKYSSKVEKPQIEITSVAGEDEIVYSIRDNGIGFDMAFVHKLFGVFQRLHSDEEFEGTGVGLAIVQRIIHQHGGKVWAESKPHEGATFSFSIPATAEVPLHEVSL